jgi:undecaprenyl-diphosphatase
LEPAVVVRIHPGQCLFHGPLSRPGRMDSFNAFLLGVLQGATEFLPVSSSGHLVLGQGLLGVSLPGIVFEVVVHLATLLSVTWVYRARLGALVRGVTVAPDPEARRTVAYLAMATLPVAIVGVWLGDQVEALFSAPRFVGGALLFTGAVLFSTRWALRRPPAGKLGVSVALAIGLAQCVALLPGVSRSGMTVTAALWFGLPPVEAAAFSFLLSIPAILGAAVLQAPELTSAASDIGGFPLGVGFCAAAVTGILAIRLFNRMLRNRSFPAFAFYCWGVGAWMLLWGL